MKFEWKKALDIYIYIYREREREREKERKRECVYACVLEAFKDRNIFKII